MRSRLRPLLALAFLALLALPPRARADDWLQFRRDPQRSAASKDPVHLPLMELWSRRSELRGRMSTAAVFHGRILFISGERGVDANAIAARSLCCADAATGAILWRHALPRPSWYEQSDTFERINSVGPAVSESGTAFAYGSVLLPPPLTGDAREMIGSKRYPFPAFSAFRAADGQLLAYQPVMYRPLKRDTEELRRSVPIFYLQRGHADGVADTIAPPNRWQLAGLETTEHSPFGHPLILGEQLAALNLVDLLIQWTPGSVGAASPATYLRFCHPSPGVTDPNVIQEPVWFLNHPMALAPNGLVISEDMTNRFLSVIPPGAQSQWHRDMPWILGTPTVHEQHLFIGAGGPGAIAAIMAFDAGTGDVGWTFPPLPLAADAVTPGFWSGTPAEAGARSGYVDVPGATPQPGAPPVRQRVRRGVPGTQGDPRAGAAPRQTLGRQVWDYWNWPGTLPSGVFSNLPTGWWTNPGLAIAGGRVYGIAKVRALPTVVALDEQTGAPIWQQPLPLRVVVHSIAASKDHLFASLEDRLLAFNLDDGKLEWTRLMPAGGSIELSKGLVFLSTDDTVHAFAPAERTYSLAVDSSYASDYSPDARLSSPGPTPRQPSGGASTTSRRLAAPDSTAGQSGGSDELAPTPARRPLADATILRFPWPADAGNLVRAAQARREAAGKLPLLVELDWTHLPGQSGIVNRRLWNAEQITDFAAACAEVAKAAHPEHLNIAPEVNVYLRRYPDQTDAVQALVAAVKQSVKRASPATRVLVSFNVEVLRGVYGQGTGRYRPFGKLEAAMEPAKAAIPPLTDLVDEIGLTSRPQSAYGKAEELPGDYLLAIKEALGEKPVLITAIEARMETDDRLVAIEQALLVKRLLQLCYWLDASIVAYPNVAADTKADRSALMVNEAARPALAAWAEALSWKMAKKLTLVRQNEPEAEQADPTAEGQP